jgi:DNA uptake protein ComE-like DNA-binding protein
MKFRKLQRQFARIMMDYLTYNRTEQRGILVLCFILTGLVIAHAFIPAGTFNGPTVSESFPGEVEAFERAWRKAADSDSIARAVRFRQRSDKPAYSSYDSRIVGTKSIVPAILVELNSADTLDLQQLKGIGPGFARRICTYRDRLGGFFDKRQVLEVFGMDTARYRLIEDHLLVNPDSIRRIDLNHVTFKELLRHPYFPFPITKNIILWRQKNKIYRSMDDLKNVEGMTDSLWRRMVIYLRVIP